MSQTADVVVIGGGVNGVSIAYALAARGVKAVLVEKGALASTSTTIASSHQYGRSRRSGARNREANPAL